MQQGSHKSPVLPIPRRRALFLIALALGSFALSGCKEEWDNFRQFVGLKEDPPRSARTSAPSAFEGQSRRPPLSLAPAAQDMSSDNHAAITRLRWAQGTAASGNRYQGTLRVEP
jgi:hypothetical protein